MRATSYTRSREGLQVRVLGPPSCRRAVFRSLALATLTAMAAPSTADCQVSLALENTIHVQIGTNSFTNCGAVIDVLDGINDAAQDNRYLIHLPPGEYECGRSNIVLKKWTTLQGAGHETEISGTPMNGLGVVTLDDRTELRSVRVSSLGSTADTPAVSAFALGVINARLFDVDLFGETSDSSAAYGLLVSGGAGTQVALDHSTVHGTDFAGYVSSGSTLTISFSRLSCNLLSCSEFVVIGGPGTKRCHVTSWAFSILAFDCGVF